MTSLLVERAGLVTTVQDGGRWGWQAQGVPVSGPMDVWSAGIANLLAGNRRDEALLEITVSGPHLRFDAPVRVGVAGAAFDVSVGDRRLTVPGAADVAAGEPIRFGERTRGCRAYLAVSGGVRTVPVLGSRSMHVRTGLGGRPLRAGDRLNVGGRDGERAPAPTGLAPVVPLPEGSATLRLLDGPERGEQQGRLWAYLLATAFRLTPAVDRMGFRLAGPGGIEGPAERLSAPTVTGAVQVPPDGQPILLMADRQTTGGYAVPGIVCEVDLCAAAQLMPGDEVRFAPVTLEEAALVRAARERALMRWLGEGAP